MLYISQVRVPDLWLSRSHLSAPLFLVQGLIGLGAIGKPHPTAMLASTLARVLCCGLALIGALCLDHVAIVLDYPILQNLYRENHASIAFLDRGKVFIILSIPGPWLWVTIIWAIETQMVAPNFEVK